MRSDQFSLPRRDVIRGAGTIMALASLAGAGEVAAAEPAPTPTPAPVASANCTLRGSTSRWACGVLIV